MAVYMVSRAGLDKCNQGARLVANLSELLDQMSGVDAVVARGAYINALLDGIAIDFKHEPPQQAAERERLAAEAAERERLAAEAAETAETTAE